LPLAGVDLSSGSINPSCRKRELGKEWAFEKEVKMKGEQREMGKELMLEEERIHQGAQTEMQVLQTAYPDMQQPALL
jgi:hypothetical protein